MLESPREDAVVKNVRYNPSWHTPSDHLNADFCFYADASKHHHRDHGGFGIVHYKKCNGTLLQLSLNSYTVNQNNPVYRLEALAVGEVFYQLSESEKIEINKVYHIYCDNENVVKEFTKSKLDHNPYPLDYAHFDILNLLSDLIKCPNILVLNIKAHCGIMGNEVADQLAKNGNSKFESSTPAIIELVPEPVLLGRKKSFSLALKDYLRLDRCINDDYIVEFLNDVKSRLALVDRF